jgi:hypothetical protein
MKSKEKTQKFVPERKDLVLAVKDLNTQLALDPKIKTKDGEAFVPEATIIKDLIKYAKGFDDETGKFDKSCAVSKERTKLSDATWAVLEAIGALGSAEEKPVKKGKVEEKPAKKGNTFSDMKKEGTKVATPKKPRTGGRLPMDFKAMKKMLEESTESLSLARSFDKVLLTKRTLGEQIAEADKICKKLNIQRSIVAHIKWRIENDGWLFKDTRKHQHDESGIVYVTDVDPKLVGKAKLDMPLRALAKDAPKAKAKAEATKVAPKKVEKKADKKAEKVAVKKSKK